MSLGRSGQGVSTHRKPLSDDLFALPPALFSFTEELHIAMCEMWPVMSVEYEETRWRPSWCYLAYQGLLACLEQGIVLKRYEIPYGVRSLGWSTDL